MRRLSPCHYRVMPWKNGGGTTTELYAEAAPPGLAGVAFLWRVSIAEVAADGPFSLFAGVDRHIMAIAGPGMVLEGGPAGPIDVTRPFTPRKFSGDWPIVSRLIAGPIRDFNLMSLRSHVGSRLSCLGPQRAFRLGGTAGRSVFAHLISGELVADGEPLQAGDSLVLPPGERAEITLPPHSAPPRLAVCEVWPIDQGQAG